MDKNHKKDKSLHFDPVDPCCDEDNSCSEYKLFGGYDSPLSPTMPRFLPDFDSDFGSTVTALVHAPQTAPLISVRGERQKRLCASPQTAPAAFECEHHWKNSTIFRFPPDLTTSAMTECTKPSRLVNTLLSKPMHIAQKGSEPTIQQEVPSANHALTQLRQGIIPLPQIRAEAGKIVYELNKLGLGICTPLQPNFRPIQLAVPHIQTIGCGYCISINKPWHHNKKQCPELANLRPCKICGASGSKNHTIKYCPKRQKVVLKMKTLSAEPDN